MSSPPAAFAAATRAAAASLPVALAYASVGDEPPTRGLLDGLADRGVEVWLPVVVGADLHWGPYAGWESLRPAAFGLLEPVATRTDPPAAGVAFVPALAVDRHGNRLGRGRGYYDRVLSRLSVRSIAVVYDDELLDDVPTEPGDVPVHAALTPSGLVPLR